MFINDFCKTFFKELLTILINCSQNSPHQGVFPDIKLHLVFFCIRNYFNFLEFLKVFALSLINFVDLLLREMRRFKANNRFSALRSEVISKCTAWLNIFEKQWSCIINPNYLESMVTLNTVMRNFGCCYRLCRLFIDIFTY